MAARPQRSADRLHDNDAPATSAFASVESLADTRLPLAAVFPEPGQRRCPPPAARAVVKAPSRWAAVRRRTAAVACR